MADESVGGMKFLINGKEYDAEMGLRKATLLTLFELKSRHGIGIKTLADTAKRFQHVKDPMELLEDEESFKLFLVVIWLARKYAGEKLTLEEANDDFAIGDMRMIVPDEVPDTDPKASGAAANVPPIPVQPPTI